MTDIRAVIPTLAALLISIAACCGAQVSAVEQIQDAIGKNDLVGARALLVTAMLTNPQDAGLLNLRGVVHAQSGEFADARNDFAKAVAASPDLLAAWQNWARACQVDGDHDAAAAACAERAWKRVLERRPADIEANRGMALAYERLGKYADSLRLLEKLPEDPNFGTADLMIRCLDLLGLKQYRAAVALARRLGARPDFQEGDLDAMSRLLDAGCTVVLAEALDARGELKPDGLRRLAVTYETTGQLPEARKTLERLVGIEPDNAAHLLELGHVAEKQKDYEGALGYLGHARLLRPADAQVQFLFGVVAAEMKLPVEARLSFAKALELDPKNPDYNYAMGAVILSTGDAAPALSYFQKYIEARPERTQGHYALGVAQFVSGDFDSSKAQMAGVLHDPAVAGGAEYFLGRIERLQDNLKLAEEHLSKAIRLLPKSPDAHTEMARLRMLQNNDEAAKVELQSALRLDPNSFQANAQLLVLYKRTHDTRAFEQVHLLKKLGEDRSRSAELMLRTVEIRP